MGTRAHLCVVHDDPLSPHVPVKTSRARLDVDHRRELMAGIATQNLPVRQLNEAPMQRSTGAVHLTDQVLERGSGTHLDGRAVERFGKWCFVWWW